MFGKFQYMIIGVGLILVALLGAFLFLRTPVQADTVMGVSTGRPPVVTTATEVPTATLVYENDTFAAEAASLDKTTAETGMTPITDDGSAEYPGDRCIRNFGANQRACGEE
ncbi:MAG: hypothetical protein R3C44_20520 [Chloroflexota bacterium]